MWFVRVGSKVTGPFNEAQLRGMRQRGEFSPIHQVSADRMHWESAAPLAQMLDGPLPQWPTPPKPAPGGQSPGEQSQSGQSSSGQPATGQSPTGQSFLGRSQGGGSGGAPAGSRANWYYVDARRQQIGPVPEESLRELLATGKVYRRAMVCRQGDATWGAAQARPEFAGSLPARAKWFWLTVGGVSTALVAASLLALAIVRGRNSGETLADLSAKQAPANSQRATKTAGRAGAAKTADPQSAAGSPNAAGVPAEGKSAQGSPDDESPQAASGKSAAAGGANPMTPVEQMISRVLPSVALIRGSAGSGSGFLVSAKLLVTNRHVIETELTETLKIYFPSAKEGERGPYSGSVIFEHEERDLAFIALNTNLPFLKTAPPSSFRPGGKVVVIGNPGSRVADSTTGGVHVVVNAVTHGYMSAEVNVAGKKFYHFDITVNHGNSGGPALDSNGEVVAVVDLGENGADRLNYFIPAFEVSAAVERLQKLTENEVAVNQAKHQAKVFFVSINNASMRRLFLIAKRLQKEIGLKDIAADRQLKILDYCFMELLHPHFSSVLADPHLSPAIHEKLQAYANNYGELKIAQESLEKRISNATMTKLNQLATNFKDQSDALSALLGPPIDVQLSEND